MSNHSEGPIWSAHFQKYLHKIWEVQYQRYYWTHYVEGQGWVFFSWCSVDQYGNATFETESGQQFPVGPMQRRNAISGPSSFGIHRPSMPPVAERSPSRRSQDASESGQDRPNAGLPVFDARAVTVETSGWTGRSRSTANITPVATTPVTTTPATTTSVTTIPVTTTPSTTTPVATKPVTTTPVTTIHVTTTPVTNKSVPGSWPSPVADSQATIGTEEKAIQAECSYTRNSRRPPALPAMQPTLTSSSECESCYFSKSHHTEPTASSDTFELVPDISKALAAWKALFGDQRQVRLGPREKLPIQATRFLGSGGGGQVHATEIGGIAVAWKRYVTTARTLSVEELNEATVLEKLSKRRHRHVVKLIGSYIHRHNFGVELGLLIWPVAHCDLVSFLNDVDYLGDWIHDLSSGTYNLSEEDIESVLENLCPLLMPEKTSHDKVDDLDSLQTLYEKSTKYLYSKMTCIGEAVAYLHEQDIRHKDLKPAQILLSASDLWLTDFGWSRDTSNLTNSVTNGSDTTTFKYHAPERAASGPCGKPEDIFALGCIYLEMGYRIARDPQKEGYAVPWAKMPFHENLDHLETWVAPLSEDPHTSLHSLALLIRRMLSRHPGDRPRISLTLEILHSALDRR